MAEEAPALVRDLAAVVRPPALEEDLAPALRLGEGGAERPVAVRRPRDRHRVVVHGAQLLGVEGRDAGEEHRQPRPALPRQGRVRALPLEGVGVVDPPQRPVVHRAHADAVGLDVVGQAVDVPVRVAGGAGELPLEGDVRAVEELLPPPDVRSLLRPAEVDPRHGLVARHVDDAQRVVERVRDPRRRAVRGDRDPPRVVLHRDASDHELGRGARASWEGRRGGPRRRSASGAPASSRRRSPRPCPCRRSSRRPSSRRA